MEYPRNTKESIYAYLFPTEKDATEALETINAGEGFPVDDNHVTQTYTTVKQFSGGWYIISDAVTDKYLQGNPQQIEV